MMSTVGPVSQGASERDEPRPVLVIHGIGTRDKQTYLDDVAGLNAALGQGVRLIPVYWGDMGAPTQPLDTILPYLSWSSKEARATRESSAEVRTAVANRAAFEQAGDDDAHRNMPAWLAILLVMILVGVLVRPGAEGFAWFLQLRRPRWLSFERWIPLIWMAIYACFYLSALKSWQQTSDPALMLGYLVLLLLVQSYTLVICRTRRLATGTAVGFAGWVWGMALLVATGSRAGWAAALLIPYLLWSPVGTFVTWQMQRLNR